MRINRTFSLGLSIFGSFLLFLSWHPRGFTSLVFIALVPLLLQLKINRQHPFAVFYFSFLGFFIFHVLTARWMYSSTFVGSLVAHLLNSSYMAMVLFMWSVGQQRLKSSFFDFLLLSTLWLTFEFTHHHWELAWPWFTLGHVFAEKPEWVQWYSYTGSLGGSLWVIASNWLIYKLILMLEFRNYKSGLMLIVSVAFLIIFPLQLSEHLKNKLETPAQSLQVIVVQPNIHPLKEKFGGLSQSEQLKKSIELLRKNWSDSIQLAIFPETMITESIDETRITDSDAVHLLLNAVPSESKAGIISGAFTRRSASVAPYDKAAIITDSIPYVLYNSALLLQKEGVQIYHKHHLVPLVEKQPFLWMMKPLRAFVEKSGGFFGRYGSHNTRPFFYLNDSVNLAPIICFESAFGGYLNSALNENAQLIVLITNDGWWDSDGGYKQHLALSRLRAIESNRWIVRSANTGVSAIIDSKGKIVMQTPYDTEAVLVNDVPLLNQNTFYTEYGDILGKLAALIAFLLSALFILKRH